MQQAKLLDIAAALLEKAAQKGATQAEIGIQFSQGEQVSVRQRTVETVGSNQDKSVSITVYQGKQKGSTSTNDFHEDSLNNALEAAIQLASITGRDLYSGLANPEDIARHIPDLQLCHPWEMDTREAIQLALEIEEAALSYDKRICNSDGANVHKSQGIHVYGNSHGFLAGYPTSRHSMSCVVMGAGEKGMERNYEYTVACHPQALWSAERVGQGAAERTLARLDPRTIPTQKIPILFDRTLSHGLISHFIAAISGGNLFRKASFLCDSLGKRVFPTAFSLYEEPYLISKLGSSPFDGDGVATLARPLVQKGAIQSYVLSAYSARQLGLQNTGNAGGVTNLRVEYPCVSQKELLQQMHTGLWVTELMGQGVNLITGDYSRGAAGFWVDKGHIQYPVSGVTIAGHLGDMLANIVGIADDVDERSSVFVGSILVDAMMVAGG